METRHTRLTHVLMEPYEPIVADTSQFPAFRRDNDKAIAPQIAQHLALLLKQLGREAEPTALQIPSAMALSDFYQCTPLDMLDGLYLFRQRNYDYVMNGLDAVITLHAQAHILKARPSTFWRSPWELTHKIAECPIVNLFPGKAG